MSISNDSYTQKSPMPMSGNGDKIYYDTILRYYSIRVKYYSIRVGKSTKSNISLSPEESP